MQAQVLMVMSYQAVIVISSGLLYTTGTATTSEFEQTLLRAFNSGCVRDGLTRQVKHTAPSHSGAFGAGLDISKWVTEGVSQSCSSTKIFPAFDVMLTTNVCIKNGRALVPRWCNLRNSTLQTLADAGALHSSNPAAPPWVTAEDAAPGLFGATRPVGKHLGYGYLKEGIVP